jgi:hypothetical protein
LEQWQLGRLMEKVCTRCKEAKPVVSFSFKNKAKETRRSICSECVRPMTRAHYASNPAPYKARAIAHNKQVRDECRRRVYEHLSRHPCVDCGEGDPDVLEFDHVRGEKVNNVTTLFRTNRSWAMVEREIAKCEVCCANCHRRRTAKRAGWSRRLPDRGIDQLVRSSA